MLTDHQVTTSPDQVATSPDQVTNLNDQVPPSPDQVSPSSDQVLPSPAQVTTLPDQVSISPDDQQYVWYGYTSPLWTCTNAFNYEHECKYAICNLCKHTQSDTRKHS